MEAQRQEPTRPGIRRRVGGRWSWISSGGRRCWRGRRFRSGRGLRSSPATSWYAHLRREEEGECAWNKYRFAIGNGLHEGVIAGGPDEFTQRTAGWRNDRRGQAANIDRIDGNVRAV